MPFEDVWPVAVDVVQGRGYGEIRKEWTEAEETYTRTKEVEDQPRDRQVSKTVSEGYGQIVARLDDGRIVPLELQERHQWKLSTLDFLAELDGRDSRTLQHDGVAITVAGGYDRTVHMEEAWAVIADIRERFE